VTGFEFRGRHGTAVVRGVVVANEYREAVEAVIKGFRDERAQEEEERRTLAALRMWKRFLVSLRIKERVDAYEEGEEKDAAAEDEAEVEAGEENEAMESDEYGGGGFFPE
jgi:xeroderma pigmentosum group C-complementing protein